MERLILPVFCALWLTPLAQAASPSVTAVLSDSEAAVGNIGVREPSSALS